MRSTLSAQGRLASLLVLPDDFAKSLAEDQKAAADLLAVLDQAKKSMASDRKGEALEKLNRARKKLELLRMFCGDPKAVVARGQADRGGNPRRCQGICGRPQIGRRRCTGRCPHFRGCLCIRDVGATGAGLLKRPALLRREKRT